MKPTIAIIGATVTGNHGAEAMLATVIGRLKARFPGARFLVYSYYARADAALVSRHDVEFLPASPQHLLLVLFPFSLLLAGLRFLGLGKIAAWFPRSVARLARADCMIDLAGVSFIDGREIYLGFNILTVAPAMLLGAPVVKLAQAVGPFKSVINRVAAKLVLARCAHVFARGDRTGEHLRELGMDARKWSRASDVAFLMEDEDALSREGSERLSRVTAELAKAPGEMIVGICPSSVVAGKRPGEYEHALAQLVQTQLAKGRKVVLFPNATRAARMDKRFNNDLPVIAAIVEKIPHAGGHRGLFVIDFDVHATDIRRLIGRCDLIVTSRFHAMVFALTIAVPTLVIGWSHKYAEVLDEFGLSQRAVNVDTGGALALEEAVDQLAGALEEERAIIRTRLPAVQAQARAQIDLIERILT